MKETRYGKTNYKTLLPFIDTVDRQEGHANFTAPGFMDLTIEYIYESDYEGNPVYSICHYGEQNGDLMRDPEITFSINRDLCQIMPITYQNDYIGYYDEIFKTNSAGKTVYSPSKLNSVDDFLRMWCRNIKAQGFTANIYRKDN